MMNRTSNDSSGTLQWIVTLTWLLLLLPASGLTQQSDRNILRVERFQVDHRDPPAVRELLVAELGGQEHIGVIGDWLIVAATDSTRNRIQERLATLDTPIRQVEVTLSFDAPGEDSEEDATQPVMRSLLVEKGQLVRLDLPVPDRSGVMQEPGPVADTQLSFRLDTSGRLLQLSHIIHPVDTEAEPDDTGTQQQIHTGDWHSLGNGIAIRVRPRN